MLDLHSHSTRSDGRLSPNELVTRAADYGVTTLALTDHDTAAGLPDAAAAARRHDMELVAGVEISVTWQRRTLHIVGLAFDPDDPTLAHSLARLQTIRAERAAAIGAKLEKLGVHNAFERARSLAGDGQIGRNHFARVLIESGFCDSFQKAFKNYLKPGRNAYVSVEWTALDSAVDAIHAAGGLAVLAHPFGYRFSASWRRRMLGAFTEAGGDAVEVCTGTTNANDIRQIATQTAEHGLYASLGSDFHSPEQHWLELGRVAALPRRVTPVWEAPEFKTMTSARTQAQADASCGS